MGWIEHQQEELVSAERSRAAQAVREARKSKRRKTVKSGAKKAKRKHGLEWLVDNALKHFNEPIGAKPIKWVKYRPGMGLEFYNSDKWREVRAKVLKAGKGVCCKCGATRQTSGKPMHVDHAYPRYSYPHLELSMFNLQVMCEPCNMDKKSTIWVSPWLRSRREVLKSGKSQSKDRCQNPPP